MKVNKDTYKEVSLFVKNLKSTDLVELDCNGCDKTFYRTRARIRAAVKCESAMYCSKNCYPKRIAATGKHVKCYNCKKVIYRAKSKVTPSSKHYCSRTCAVIVNNKNRLKTYTRKVQCGCGGFKYAVSKGCNACKQSATTQRFLNSTFAEYKQRSNNESYKYYARIRGDTRKHAERYYDMPKLCHICGYSFYVELCHIKAISSFPDTATMAEINAKENLVYLCPNHHKEQEAGILSIVRNL